MIVKEINITSFGCISNKNYTFGEHFNVIYGKNESGKSTLLAFILFVFYGTKHKKEPNAPAFKDKYIAWNDHKMEGSIRFVSNGLEYYLTRMYFEGKTKVTLHCLTTGEEITDSSILSSVGEYFIGVGAESFVKSTYFSALTASVTTGNSDEINTKIRNLYETGAVDLSYADIKKSLENEIADLESDKRKNALIPKLENELYENETLLRSEQRKKDKKAELQKLISKENDNLENMKTQLEKLLDRSCSEENSSRSKIGYLYAFPIFLLVVSCGLIFFKSYIAAAVAFFILTIAFLCVKVFIISKNKSNSRKHFTKKQFDDKIEMLRKKISDAEIAKAVYTERYNNISINDSDKLILKQNDIKKKLQECRMRIQGLTLALDCVDNAYAEMKTLFSPALARKTAEIFSKLTLGKYSDVIVDDKLSVTMLTNGGYKSSMFFSRGTSELLYIALRIAVSELIFEQESIPLLLDDAFVTLDSERLKVMLDYIACISENKQVFMATCKDEEYQYLITKNDVNIIKM